MEIKNKVTVTRGEVGRGIIGENRRRAIREHVYRTHGQNQKGKVRGWGGGMVAGK